ITRKFRIPPVFMNFQPPCETRQTETTHKPHVISALQPLAKLTGYTLRSVYLESAPVHHPAVSSLPLRRRLAYTISVHLPRSQTCPSQRNCLPFLSAPTARRP